MLAINEVFGPTFQGEGPSLGRLSVFLRLAGCNLKCSWCDTPYTWDWQGVNGVPFIKDDEMTVLTSRKVALQLAPLAHGASLLVVTGGEPMLQQRGLQDFFDQYWFADIEIETNGTVAPALYHNHLTYNVSPKLANSGSFNSSYDRRKLHPDYLHLPNARFKFVVQDVSDLNEIKDNYGDIDSSRIWIMPEGTDQWKLENKARVLADEVLKRGWNMTTRLHVQLWGNERAR